MKTSCDDEKLCQLLRDNWAVNSQTNPNFRTAVWARIETYRHQPSTWGGWLRNHIRGVASLAIACVAIAIAGGGFMARASSQHERGQLIERYLASIDPHRQVAPTNHP